MVVKISSVTNLLRSNKASNGNSRSLQIGTNLRE